MRSVVGLRGLTEVPKDVDVVAVAVLNLVSLLVLGMGWAGLAGLASGFELESELEMLVMVCQGFKALKQLAMTLSSLSLRVGLLLKFQFMFKTLDPLALIA